MLAPRFGPRGWLGWIAVATLAAADQPTLRSYHADDGPLPRAGGVRMVPITTPKGTFKVWTKRIGNNPRIRLLLLHGGPAATHEYFECFESYLPAAGIELIYYDQLGAGNSDRPHDNELWTLERYVDEVDQVRKALGLSRKDFFLLGHSWGGILGVEYALKYPNELKGLVISNMMMSIPDYNRYADQVLAKGMDPAVVQEVRQLEAHGQYESPRYMELLIPNFYAKHLCRLADWPDAVHRAFAHLNKEIYVLMQGPSEFGASGRLERWDRKADLAKIEAPTLVIGARHDTMDPQHMAWVARQVQHGTYVECPDGSHLAMWDDQEVYFKGLLAFLRAHEGSPPP